MNQAWLTFLRAQGGVVEGGRIRHFGDPAAERRAAAEETVLVELSDLSLIRVRGADALAFLNAQLSNDVRRVDDTHTQLAAWCNPKGRALALFRVLHRGDDYLLQLPGTLQETVLKRLRMFVLRAKVVLDSADDEQVSFGLAGPRAEALLREALGALPDEASDCVMRGDISVLRVSATRYMVIAPVGDATGLWQRLRAAARPAAADRWAWLDIAAGVPQVYPETSEAFVPQMLNLELLGGVDFKKGCYPGQEIVARLHYRGGLKQRLFRLHADQEALPGTPVYAPDLPGQAVGTVAVAAAAPGGGTDLLAVLSIASAARGALHVGTESGPLLRLLDLPYAMPMPESADGHFGP